MNNNLSTILISQYNEKILSHVFLIESNNFNKTINEINKLIKTIESEKNKNISKSIDDNMCPGILYINPDGNSIKKEPIDQLREKFSYIPTFTINNYYIITECEKMNSTAYNRLLKFMEEPNDNIIGFLITSNKSLVPETIVSRCDCYKNFYNEESVDKIDNIIIDKYTNYIKINDLDILCYNEDVLSKLLIDKSDYTSFLNQLMRYYLNINNFGYANIIKCYLKKLDYNVNLSLFINSFAIEMVNYGQNL